MNIHWWFPLYKLLIQQEKKTIAHTTLTKYFAVKIAQYTAKPDPVYNMCLKDAAKAVRQQDPTEGLATPCPVTIYLNFDLSRKHDF